MAVLGAPLPAALGWMRLYYNMFIPGHKELAHKSGSQSSCGLVFRQHLCSWHHGTLLPMVVAGRCTILSYSQYTFVAMTKQHILTFSDSPHDGLIHSRSGSFVIVSSFLWNSSRQQSMIRMMRCGGLPSLRTVEMSEGLMVLRAASASSRAGRAASNFTSATALSASIVSTITWALSLTF